jgi:hypothetical protein
MLLVEMSKKKKILLNLLDLLPDHVKVTEKLTY